MAINRQYDDERRTPKVMSTTESLKFVFQQMSLKTRWQMVLSCLLLTVAAMMELLGIGLVFPIVHVMSADSLESQHHYVRAIASFLSIDNPQQLAKFGVIGLAALLILKSVFSIVARYWTVCLINRGRISATRKLFSAYLDAPLSYHDNLNTASVLYNLTGHCNRLFMVLPLSLIMGGVDFFLAAGMTTILVIASPMAALTSLALGILGLIMNNILLSRSIHRLTKRSETEAVNFSKIVLESMRGIKVVRVQACEPKFLREFDITLNRIVDAQNKMMVINVLPAHFFEVLCGLLLVFVFLLLLGTLEPSVMVPTLALFAVAAIRLLPAAGRLATHYNTIQAAGPAAEIIMEANASLGGSIFDEEREWPNRSPENPPMGFMREIKLHNVSFEYGRGTAGVRNIYMTIPRGQCVGIVGPSGAGKSTLINLILGLQQPTRGSISIDGIPCDPDLSAYFRSIGFVPQDVFVADDTIRANVAFGSTENNIDDSRVQAALAEAQLLEFATSLPDGLDTLVGESGVRLSGGQRQRLGIARALYEDPQTLVLDEATSSLDLETEHQITQVISSLHKRKTVVVVAHRLSTVKQCDWIYYLREGEVAAEGTFNSLQSDFPEFKSLVELGQLGSA